MRNVFPARILVATDGSEDALLAAQAAIDLSNRTVAELHVVHAWQDLRPPTLPAMAINEYAQAYEQWKQEAGELLDKETERLREAGGTVSGAHLREGRPAEEINNLAKELDVGLVIIGSRGLGAMKRLVMGSVSEGVVHLAPCPTLVVRGGERAWPPRRLIIGDDASEEARRAGELAMGIGKLFDARALLVWVHTQVTVFKARRIVHTRASKELLKKGKRSLGKRAAELESVLGMRPEIRVTSGRGGRYHSGGSRGGPRADASGSWAPWPGRREALGTGQRFLRCAKGRKWAGADCPASYSGVA